MEHEYQDDEFKISNLTFTARRTNAGRMFLGVKDDPLRHQNVIADHELLVLLEAVYHGDFDGPADEWRGRDGQYIQWTFWGVDRADVVIEKDGYRLWLTVHEFRLLVDHLKRLLGMNSDVLQEVERRVEVCER